MPFTPLVTASEVGAAVPSFLALTTGEQAALITSVTATINSICDRILGLATYAAQLYHPGRSRLIVLREYPVLSISRLATDLMPVLTIQNTEPANQEATVAFTTTGPVDAPTFTGIEMTAVDPAGATVTTLAFADYPTLGALAAAIASHGDGWTATVAPGVAPVMADLAGYACANLIGTLGPCDAKVTPLDLMAFARNLQYRLVPDGPRTRQVILFEGRPDGFRYPDMARGWGYGGGLGYGPGCGYGGDADRGAVAVSYRAGYDTSEVPGDLKQVAIDAIQFERERQQSSGAFKSKTVGKVSWVASDLPRLPLPDYLIARLARHRRCDLA